MAVQRFVLPLADIYMAMDMFDASPDGARERDRIERLIAELPDGQVTIGGHICSPDCAHFA